MNTQKPIIGTIAFVSGLLIFAGMVLYFLLMKFAGFAHIPELRFLNVLLAATGAAGAVMYYNRHSGKHIKYLNGLLLGFSSIMIGSVLFAVFIFTYFTLVDPALLAVISTDAPITGIHISPFTTAISVTAEGAVSGFIISFILMQYFKDDELHDPYKRVSHGGLRTEEE